MTEEGKRDPRSAGLAGTQRVFHWHADTFDLPSDMALLATSDATVHQAFRCGPRAYGLQNHIELDEQVLNTWLYHHTTKGLILSTLGRDGYTTLEHIKAQEFTPYRAHTRLEMHNFLRMSTLV